MCLLIESRRPRNWVVESGNQGFLIGKQLKGSRNPINDWNLENPAKAVFESLNINGGDK